MSDLTAMDVSTWAVLRLTPIVSDGLVSIEPIVEGVVIGPYDDAVKLRGQLIAETGQAGSRAVREQFVVRSTFVWNYQED